MTQMIVRAQSTSNYSQPSFKRRRIGETDVYDVGFLHDYDLNEYESNFVALWGSPRLRESSVLQATQASYDASAHCHETFTCNALQKQEMFITMFKVYKHDNLP